MTTLLALYDSVYRPFVLPCLLRNTSIQPSLSSLSNLLTSQDKILSNSLNLSLEK